MEQNVLTEMASLLNSDSVNYSVFLRAYSGASERSNSIDDIVDGLLGHHVVVDGVRDTNVTDVSETLRQTLGYVGDDSAGPGTNALQSSEFSRLLGRILTSVVKLSESAYAIKSLEFGEGHPAYPVFWDFAFLFLRNEQHVLLVGSSSD